METCGFCSHRQFCLWRSYAGPVRALILLTVFAAGCGFEREMQTFDGGGDGPGGGGDGGAGGDAGMTACPLPVLLMAVEQLGGAGPGRIMRFSLDASGSITPCSALTARGALPQQPFAVAHVPPDRVAAATRDGLYVIDFDDDIVFSRSGTMFPVSVFPIKQGSVQHVAVGLWSQGTSNPEIDRIEVYRDGSSAPIVWNAATVGFPQRFPMAAAAPSPIDPGRFFALDEAIASTPNAAADVDPFAQSKTSYVSYPAGRNLVSISSYLMGGQRRTVWVDESGNAIYYTRELSGNPALSGPIKCALTCNLVHAVPDPTDPVRFLALCEKTASIERDIVRFSSTGGNCTVVYQGVDAGAQTRLAQLAVALP